MPLTTKPIPSVNLLTKLSEPKVDEIIKAGQSIVQLKKVFLVTEKQMCDYILEKYKSQFSSLPKALIASLQAYLETEDKTTKQQSNPTIIVEQKEEVQQEFTLGDMPNLIEEDIQLYNFFHPIELDLQRTESSEQHDNPVFNPEVAAGQSEESVQLDNLLWKKMFGDQEIDPLEELDILSALTGNTEEFTQNSETYLPQPNQAYSMDVIAQPAGTSTQEKVEEKSVDYSHLQCSPELLDLLKKSKIPLPESGKENNFIKPAGERLTQVPKQTVALPKVEDINAVNKNTKIVEDLLAQHGYPVPAGFGKKRGGGFFVPAGKKLKSEEILAEETQQNHMNKKQ
ncbi:Uncharacterised protein [Legionella busanensis]|uniref:Uncharacterized protein n=1 Tax=Legionella busanensis TaxID=190655 RepID=A0A378JLI4_9GAMM|nr:hypothetical protein [Legionella busanensis]STX52064.1 Uncharacterised protein [Legionella busanensis]